MAAATAASPLAMGAASMGGGFDSIGSQMTDGLGATPVVNKVVRWMSGGGAEPASPVDAETSAAEDTDAAAAAAFSRKAAHALGGGQQSQGHPRPQGSSGGVGGAGAGAGAGLGPRAARPSASAERAPEREDSPSWLDGGEAETEGRPMGLALDPAHAAHSAADGDGAWRGFSWEHDKALAIALLPALCLVLASVGFPLLATLGVGAALAYLADQLGYQELSFVTAWASCAAGVVVTVLYGPYSISASYPLSVLLLLCATSVLLLCAAWASLHHTFALTELRPVAVVFERVLFAAAPYPACALLVSMLMAAVGPDHAPFYVAASQALVLVPVMLPRLSACAPVDVVSAGPLQALRLPYVAGDLVTAVHCATYTWLPALLYAATHRVALITWTGLCSSSLLVLAPAAHLCLLVTTDVFW